MDSQGPVSLSQFLHKAVIEVDELGTEASSPSTEVLQTQFVLQSRPTTFVADHPFLFVLIENSKVLFVGRKVL